jgi:para-nitrobenzyl esterase
MANDYSLEAGGRLLIALLRCVLVIANILASGAIVEHATAQAPVEGPDLVNVDGGSVRGRAAGDVIAFRGIPFAAPPIGELRWRPPQPPQPWQGIREAAAFRPDPLQPRSGGSLSFQGSSGNSEDCLYINVWRPAKTDGRPLPVMVWIYGGGLVRGGASLYPGDFLARHGIVVVTFNYRVGRLGFFAHPALGRESPDAPRGNYGYMDQISALKWVQRNIAAFGGDPQNVTIAGESAGGGAVLVLMTSPLARGLFQRSILQSPGIPTPRANVAPMRSLAAAETIAVDYARGLGIEGDDKAALAALRALSGEKLIQDTEAYALAIFGGPDIPGISHSIIDGRLVVEPPEEALRAGRQAMVPVIVGANDFDIAITPLQTKDELFAQFGTLAAQARTLYDPRGDATFEAARQAVVADLTMVEPSRNLAELVAKSGQPAYFYRFSYVAESQRPTAPGALHGSEIIYALDAAAALLRDKATKADLEMARSASGYWTAFIKTGNPNGDGRPEWPPYDPARRDVLNFTNTGVTVGPDPWKERLDLWRAVRESGR